MFAISGRLALDVRGAVGQAVQSTAVVIITPPPPTVTTTQNARQCRNKDPMVTASWRIFSSTETGMTASVLKQDPNP